MLYDILVGGGIINSSKLSTVACPQCGLAEPPVLKIRNNEFLIKCKCCSYTVHTTEVMKQLIEIWNKEAEKNANSSKM